MIGVSTNDKYPVLIIVDNFGQLFVVDYVTIEIVILYGTVLWYGTWYLVPAGTCWYLLLVLVLWYRMVLWYWYLLLLLVLWYCWYQYWW